MVLPSVSMIHLLILAVHLLALHHLINFALVGAENAPVVPAVLDKGHQSNRTLRRPGLTIS